MKVCCQNFPDDYPLLERDKELNVTLPALIWAAITVGAPSLHEVDLSSWPAISFALHKAFAIESVMNIENNEVSLHPCYDNLDQSEKGVLSYWTGMIMTKLVSEQLLDVSYPAHVRAMQKKMHLTTDPQNSRSLPDLIGQDRSKKWHVLEAKCHKKDPGSVEKSNWTTQAQRVVEIDGIIPSTTSYCFTILQPSKRDSHFKIEWVDPEVKKDTESFRIIIDPIDLQQFYYRPFYDIFKNTDQKDLIYENEIIYSKRRICDNLHEKKWSIGILENVFDQVQDLMNQNLKNRKMQMTSYKKVEEYKKNQKDESSTNLNEYMGSDGIVVQMN
jgi:hypothetical protein